MAKGVVKDWTKNAAQAVRYTATDLTSEQAPFITTTISNAADAVKDMVDWIKRNTPDKSANSNKEPFIKRALNKSKDTFKVAMDDVKSGHLNFDGINAKFGNSMDDLFGDFDDSMDFGPDFDDSDPFSDDDSESSSSSKYEGLTSEMYASGLEISTKANIDALSQSSSLISQSTMNAASAATKQMIAANFANTARISSQLADVIVNTKATNDNIASLVEFNNNTVQPFYSQAQEYMEHTEQTLNDIKAILETRLVNPEKTKDSYKKKDLIRGGIDVKGYLKRISGSMMVQAGMQYLAPAFTILNNMGVPLPDSIKDDPMMMGFEFNPIKSIAKYALPSLFGKNSKLKDLDSILEYAALKFADKLYDSEAFSDFGQRMYDRSYIDKSKYEQGAVTWSGRDSKTLQVAIPTYLSQIETNTSKTADNLGELIDILHTTLMGEGTKFNAYDVYGRAKGGMKSYNYKRAVARGEIDAPHFSLRDRNSIRTEEFNLSKESNKRIAKSIEEGGTKAQYHTQRVYKSGEKKGQGRTYKDGTPMYSARKAASIPDKASQVQLRRESYARGVQIAKERAGKAADDKENIWDVQSNSMISRSKLKESYQWSVDSTYAPFGDFYEALVKEFDLTKEDKARIETLVTKWANRVTRISTDKLVDTIVDELCAENKYHDWEEGYGTNISKPFPQSKRVLLAATLAKANQEFLTERQNLIDEINSGESKFGLLDTKTLENTTGVAKFASRADTLEEAMLKIYTPEQQQAYFKKKKIEEEKKKRDAERAEMPFKNAIENDEDYILENGVLSESASWFEKFLYNVKKGVNDSEVLVNKAAKGIHNNALNQKLDKSATAIVDVWYDAFGKITNALNEGKAVSAATADVQNIFMDAARQSANIGKNQAANGAWNIKEEGWWLLHPNERVLTPEQVEVYDEIQRKLRDGELISTLKPKKQFSLKDKVDLARIQRRKPTNEDEKEYYDDVTNKEIEKAETQEQQQFEMQREMTENIRTIAATSIASSDREIAKDKADGADAQKSMAKTLWGKLSDFLFGARDNNGFYTDGPFAKFLNGAIGAKRKFMYDVFGKGYTDEEGNVYEGKDAVGGLKAKISEYKDSMSTTLFGKKKSSISGVSDSDQNDDEELVDSEPINDAVEEVAENVKASGDAVVEATLGTDGEDPQKVAVRSKKAERAKWAARIGKGALIGGIGALTLKSSLGTIPSLLFPGGPVAGAILGIGASIVSQTETFKKIVFGEEDENGERSGGLISKKMNERFKKVLPFVAGGAGLGLLQKFFLPSMSLIPGKAGALMNIFFGSGPIAGAILGLGGGLLASSEEFRKKIFGEEDDDGELEGGILSKPAEAIRKIYKKSANSLKGAGIGAIAGVLTHTAAKSGGGLLMKAFGMGGPIGAAIVGSAVGIAAKSEKFQELMFGKDTGKIGPDGKPIRDNSGILGRMKNMFEINVIRPLAEWGEYSRDSFINWLKHDLGDHVKGIFAPLQESVAAAADTIEQNFGKFGNILTTVISNVFHPVKKLLPNLLKLTVGASTKVLSGAAKMTGDMISAPFKVLDFAINGGGLFKFGRAGGKLFKEENRAFEKEFYGVNGHGGRLASFGNWMFKRKDWLANRQAFAEREGIKDSSGFMYYNKKADAKKDRKDVTDEYKRKAGITKRMQKWAATDGFNEDVNLDAKELAKRKKFLSNHGVNTEGWTNKDLTEFMYSNDEKRKAKIQADEDVKLQREANNAEIKSSENLTEISGKLDKLIEISDASDKLMGTTPTTGGVLTPVSTTDEAGDVTTESETSDSGNTAKAVKHRVYHVYEDGTPVLNAKGKQAYSYASGPPPANGVKDTKVIPRTNDNGDTSDTSVAKQVAEAKKSPLAIADNVTTEKETEKILQKVNNDDDIDVSKDMPSQGSADIVIGGLVTNKLEEKAKEKAGSEKSSDDKGNSVTSAIADAVEDNEESGGILSTLLGWVGKGLAVGGLAMLATKIDWSSVFSTITGAVGKVVEGFKDSTEESRTDVDEDGNEVVYSSALDTSNVASHLGKSAWNFAIGRNLKAITKTGISGKISNASGKLLNAGANKALKAASKAGEAVKLAAASGKGYAKAAEYAGTTVKSVLKDSGASTLEKIFAKIYKVLGNMANSKTLQKFAGTKLGTIAKSMISGLKEILSRGKKALVKKVGKLTDALSTGLAKVGIKSADDAVPILNIITGAVDTITGIMDVANLFHVDKGSVDWKMRLIAGCVGWIKGTMVGSLLDLVNDILKEAIDVDMWHSISVTAYKAISGDEDDDALDASIKQMEQECEKYNEEHGTNLSLNEYNDNVKNRTLWTKFLGLFSLDKSEKTTSTTTTTTTTTTIKNKKKTFATTDTTDNYYNSDTTLSETSEGYGYGYPSVGYGVDHYTQNDPRWGKRKYATRNNGISTSMATGGCGPTALANAASQLGVRVNPMQIASMARTNGYTADGGTNAKMFTDGAKKLGLKSSSIGRGGVKSALKSGKKVILSGKGSDGIYTKAGHIISARGLDSKGNAIVDDPMSSKSKHIPISKLMTNSTHSWAIGYGPDMTVDEAYQLYGSPDKHILVDPKGDQSTSLYYSYQQRYSDPNNESRDWANLAINGSEIATVSNGVYYNKLGGAVGTIGDAGCLMTAIASLVSNVTKRDFDPLSFSKLYGNAFALAGDILPNPNADEDDYDYIISLLNKDFATTDNGTPFVEYLQSIDGTLTATNGVYPSAVAATGSTYPLSGVSYPAVFKQGRNDIRAMLNPIFENEKYGLNTELGVAEDAGGLYGGYPVVLHGTGEPYTSSGEHAIVIRGVHRKYDADGNAYVATTMFDPGKNANNGKIIPLSDIINNDTLSRTKRIITFMPEGDGTIIPRKGWEEYASLVDEATGTTHNDTSNDAYSNTYDVKLTDTTNSGDSWLTKLGNFLTGLAGIASNLFEALGTKDLTYTSYYDATKTSSLIGDGGYSADAVGAAASNFSSNFYNSTPYASKYDSGYFSADSVSASESYATLKKKYGITEEKLKKITDNPVLSTGVGSDYQNVREASSYISSEILPAGIVNQMKMNLIPMIASHESGGDFTSAYMDTNNKLAIGIGGFNGTNAAEVLYRMVNALKESLNDTYVDEYGDTCINDTNHYFSEYSNWATEISEATSIMSRLNSYANKASGANNFSTSELSDLNDILDCFNRNDSKGYGLAQSTEIAVLNDLLNGYMSSPIEHYAKGDLLDPRSIMQLAEFGGFGPAHLKNSSLWSMIKSKTTTPYHNVYDVRDAMNQWYESNVSSFSSGHKSRISETAASLMKKSIGFAPDLIWPGATYGISDGGLEDKINAIYAAVTSGDIGMEQANALAAAAKQVAAAQLEEGQEVNLNSIGWGTGGYSSSDIYTDDADIAKYNASNPLPVTFSTRAIESRVDTVIGILRQILTACKNTYASEGYGPVTSNPIRDDQKLSNAGLDTSTRVPLYRKDVNENHVDPLRSLFNSIATSPR